MSDPVLRRWIRAAIEHFPVDRKKKDEILRRILGELRKERS